MHLLHTTERKYHKICSAFPNYAATSQNINWEMSHWNGVLFHKAVEHNTLTTVSPTVF